MRTTGPIAKATDTAAAVADVVSHSYGAYDFNGVEELAEHYDVDGVPMTVSAGNVGYEPANFPASVISVGGTSLRHADNDRGWSESAWRYGNSGCSAYFGKPEWQTDPGREALHDVVTGTNQNFGCRGSYLCNAKPGYDAPTGHGTPNGLEAFADVTP